MARGQATIEYSFVTHAMFFFGGGVSLLFMPELFQALNRYLEGIYLVIQTGAL